MSEATIESYRISPDAFSNPAASDYLGNPTVVMTLVSEFCAKVEAVINAVQAKAVDAEHAKAEIKAEIIRLADIFAGRNLAYKTIKGYNEVTLGGTLMADLGQFWRSQRAEWKDDPVCVLFDWLASLVIDKTKIADGDDMLLGIMLKPSIQYTIKVLLGTDPRRP